MTKNLRLFMVLVGLGIVFGSASASPAQNKPIILGGFKEIATTDEQAVEAAEFAVGKRVEENTEQEGLQLVSIKKAERQSVQGLNFRLCMIVGLDEEEQPVRAVIYRNLKGEFFLKSWEVVDTCDESDG